MSEAETTKPLLRKRLRDLLAAISPEDRAAHSRSACSLLASTPEFQNASTVMLFLSLPHEIDTTNLALKCWQAGKTVVVPKVSWDQKRMLPVEITSLTTGLAPANYGLREPIAGCCVPLSMIDFVVVPGLGFTENGHRIGRGAGLYDRFLADPKFIGTTCGFGYESQLVPAVPILDHDQPLTMLTTDRGIRRFAASVLRR